MVWYAPPMSLADLRTIPLFHGMNDARLERLVGAFKRVTHEAGATIFKAGDVPTTFDLLVTGTVALEGDGDERFELTPPAPLGELGSMTGLPRSTTAKAVSKVELLSVGVKELLALFDEHGDVGVSFYKNLLGVVGDKVRRDRRRMHDMRGNIIRTQKAMKQMREQVLAAEETEISKPLFESLENLIQSNRRVNYRVSPTPASPASIRLDDGRKVKVLELSEGFLKLEGTAKEIAADPTYWSGVLVMPAGEILVSGSVLREGQGDVVLRLDALVDDFKAKLDGYMTQLQLLDFVV